MRENWSCRIADVLIILVNEALIIVEFGSPKFGRLGKLNASNRNWRRCPSMGMAKFFMAEKSQFTCSGAITLLRAEFP